jgi:hypothetical protein
LWSETSDYQRRDHSASRGRDTNSRRKLDTLNRIEFEQVGVWQYANFATVLLGQEETREVCVPDGNMNLTIGSGTPMTPKMNHICATGIVLAVVSFLGIEAHAQTPTLSYAAKFVCGPRNNDVSVVQGFYETSVNIHNPHFTTVVARKKAVIARPQSENPGQVSDFVQETLRADRAVGVNCRDIRNLFLPLVPPAFIEGFLVVHVSDATPLDVTDVITARHRAGADPDVETINVYEVRPTRIIAP